MHKNANKKVKQFHFDTFYRDAHLRPMISPALTPALAFRFTDFFSHTPRVQRVRVSLALVMNEARTRLDSRQPRNCEGCDAIRATEPSQQIADGCRRPTGPVPPSFASSPCIAAPCCILRDVTGHPRPPTLAEATPSALAALPLSPRLCPTLSRRKRGWEGGLQFLRSSI